MSTDPDMDFSRDGRIFMYDKSMYLWASFYSNIIFVGSLAAYYQRVFKVNRKPHYFAAFAFVSYTVAPGYTRWITPPLLEAVIDNNMKESAFRH